MKKESLIFLVIAFSQLVAGADIIPFGLKEASIEDWINLFYAITVAVAVLMMILHGIKWITADNDEDRKQAKQGIKNVFLGLVFILLAAALVDMAYSRPSY
jgi:cytochrome bd-type quinol oxidase subunit 2